MAQAWPGANRLARTYGGVFRLCFGPKRFVVVSDAGIAKRILLTNAPNYSKGILSEILDFVMGKGLIPADGAVWQTRRRAIVPSLHRKYIENMVRMFGDSALHGVSSLQQAHQVRPNLAGTRCPDCLHLSHCGHGWQCGPSGRVNVAL